MSYNGYLDRKKARSYANSSGQCISDTLLSSATGPTGPTGLRGQDAQIGELKQGNTGPRGPQGILGPTGGIGGTVYNTIIPGTTGLNVGTLANPFQAGYFQSGRFGILEISNNAIIPTANNLYDLGATGQKFNNIYTHRLYVDNQTIIVTDPITNKNMEMSFNVTSGEVLYTYTDVSNVVHTIKSVQTSPGNPNQIDSKYLPFLSLRFLSLYVPSTTVIKDLLTTVFENVPSTTVSTGVLYNDPVATYTSGGYTVSIGSGTIDPLTDTSFNVTNGLRTFHIQQTWDALDISGDGLVYVNDGDIIISTITPESGVLDSYIVKWIKVAFSMSRNGIINTQNIQNGAVTNEKIAPFAITVDKIADNAITSSKIANGAITGDKISNNSISNEHIINGTITGDKLALNSFTSANLALNTLTTANFATGFITSDLIQNGTITADKIATQTIQNDNIQNDTITEDKLSPEIRNLLNGDIKGQTGPTGPAGLQGFDGIDGPTGNTRVYRRHRRHW